MQLEDVVHLAHRMNCEMKLARMYGFDSHLVGNHWRPF